MISPVVGLELMAQISTAPELSIAMRPGIISNVKSAVAALIIEYMPNHIVVITTSRRNFLIFLC